MTEKRIKGISFTIAFLCAVAVAALLGSPTPHAPDGTLEAHGTTRVLEMAVVGNLIYLCAVFLLGRAFGKKDEA